MSRLIPLKKGDQVAIVATAKKIEFDIGVAINCIKSWGLVPVLGQYINSEQGYFACTPKESLSDLHWALHNDNIKAIVFLRGGYGTARIVDDIQWPIKAKWLVGYSDLTSLILALSNDNRPMVHGPMCSTIGKNQASDEVLRQLLFGKYQFTFPLKHEAFIKPGTLEGTIVGGNLSLLYESIGTLNQPKLKDKILFLEEVGEPMYAIDRMLNKLKRLNLLHKVKGLIVGSFTSVENRNGYYSETVEELVCSYFPGDIPKAIGLSSGHEEVNYSMLMGVKSSITISSKEISIQYLNNETSD